MSPDNSAARWFALHVKGRYEKSTAELLDKRGIETFAPLYRARHKALHRFREKDAPLFPGYIFCNLDISFRLPVLITPGVLGFVGFGEGPHPVDTTEIETLKRVAAGAVPFEPHPYLSIGDRARITSGPLMGVEGVVCDCMLDTVVLSIPLLQRSVAVRVGRDQVQLL
jgi:transcription antitermination factor NusG